MKFIEKFSVKARFEGWVSTYHAALYRHALWMTGNCDVAVEMVQEAFFQAWISMDSLKDRDKVLPWLLTILRRAVYREQRSQYRHNETVAQLSELALELDENDPHQLLLIYRSLENLSPNHRDIVLLHYLQGFSYEEISEQLQIPKGTVMSRLSRAREAFLELELESVEGDEKVIQLSGMRGIKGAGRR